MRNTGKYLEDEIDRCLTKIRDLELYWERMPDSHAARNYLKAAPADFMVCKSRQLIFIEAKSQKSKTLRLRKFSQLPGLKRWLKAGAEAYILVHFHEVDRLFLVDINELEEGKPSWVMGVGNNAMEIDSVDTAISLIHIKKRNL